MENDIEIEDGIMEDDYTQNCEQECIGCYANIIRLSLVIGFALFIRTMYFSYFHHS
jgi:hypothetical protein